MEVSFQPPWSLISLRVGQSGHCSRGSKLSGMSGASPSSCGFSLGRCLCAMGCTPHSARRKLCEVPGWKFLPIRGEDCGHVTWPPANPSPPARGPGAVPGVDALDEGVGQDVVVQLALGRGQHQVGGHQQPGAQHCSWCQKLIFKFSSIPVSRVRVSAAAGGW